MAKPPTITIRLRPRGARHACNVGATRYGFTLCGRPMAAAIIDNAFPNCKRCLDAIKKATA